MDKENNHEEKPSTSSSPEPEKRDMFGNVMKTWKKTVKTYGRKKRIPSPTSAPHSSPIHDTFTTVKNKANSGMSPFEIAKSEFSDDDLDFGFKEESDFIPKLFSHDTEWDYPIQENTLDLASKVGKEEEEVEELGKENVQRKKPLLRSKGTPSSTVTKPGLSEANSNKRKAPEATTTTSEEPTRDSRRERNRLERNATVAAAAEKRIAEKRIAEEKARNRKLNTSPLPSPILHPASPSSSSSTGTIPLSNVLPPNEINATEGKAYGGNSSYMTKEPLASIPLSNTSSSHSSWPGTSGYSTKNGVVGLNNLGNTCYMNAGLQSLFHTYPLIEFFLKNNFNMNGTVGMNGMALVVQFQRLMKTVWVNNSAILNPEEFKTVVGQVNPLFKDNRQHDCQELVATILDKLNEQLIKWKEVTQKRIKSTPEIPDLEDARETKKIKMDENSQKRTGACSTRDHGQTKRKRLFHDPPSPDSQEEDVNDLDRTICPSDEKPQGSEETVSSSNSTQEVKEPEPGPSSDTLVPTTPLKNLKNLTLEEKRKMVEDFWNEHYLKNETVITSSFQGLFKSTVVCSVCGYVSVTFEPFIYLSLPFPKVFEQEINVFFLASDSYLPIKIPIIISLTNKIGSIIDEVQSKLALTEHGSGNKDSFVICEVHNYAISKILNPTEPMKNLNHKHRDIYVLEILDTFLINGEEGFNYEKYMSSSKHSTPMTFNVPNTGDVQPKSRIEEDWDVQEVPEGPVYGPHLPSEAPASTSAPQTSNNMDFEFDGKSCVVCLESHPDLELKQHNGCNCKLCDGCIKSCIEHNYQYKPKNDTGGARIEEDFVWTKLPPTSSDTFKCPICLQMTNINEFACKSKGPEDSTVSLRLFPVLFRITPHNPDTNNNSGINISLVGTPKLARLPSKISGQNLYNFFSQVVNPFMREYKLLLVSSDGIACGNCIASQNCSGCEVKRSDEEITLKSNISIALSFPELNPEEISLIQPLEMTLNDNFYAYSYISNTYEPSVKIEDCLRAFSETENLDEEKPTWHCNACVKKQCATKSITVARFPPYLIIVLKRFHFTDEANKINNKLIYPMTDWDLREHIAEECADVELNYDLYAVVCHIGCASAGHYISYGKNPLTKVWHYFSDTSVSESEPNTDSETRTAYVLFYERKGNKTDLQGELKEMLDRYTTSSSSSTASAAAPSTSAHLSQRSSSPKEASPTSLLGGKEKPVGIIQPTTTQSFTPLPSSITTSYRAYSFDEPSSTTDDPYAFDPEPMDVSTKVSYSSNGNGGLVLDEITELRIGSDTAAITSTTNEPEP